MKIHRPTACRRKLGKCSVVNSTAGRVPTGSVFHTITKGTGISACGFRLCHRSQHRFVPCSRIPRIPDRWLTKNGNTSCFVRTKRDRKNTPQRLCARCEDASLFRRPKRHLCSYFFRFERNHSTVLAMPCSRLTSGFQPRLFSILR